MNSKLKPCPFCGSEAKLISRGSCNYVTCSNEDECWCGMTCPVGTPEEAVQIWNRRAIDSDELLKIADSLDEGWEQFGDYNLACKDVDMYEKENAALIRKAVGE